MSDLLLTGIIDGPLAGGTPKAIELTARADIPDLSVYGIGLASNGGASNGADVTLSGSAVAGQRIYVASESVQFAAFFGFAPDLVAPGATNFNGDDAIELFENGVVVDTFGDVGVDGTDQPWEYLDGWAYRQDGTGPDATFDAASWTFSGIDALDGAVTNATAATPFPAGTYVPEDDGGETPAAAFTLELFHLSDQEAAVAALDDAPRLSAVLNALRAEDVGDDGLPDNSLTLSSGDNYIAGLFFDASQRVFGSRGIADIEIQNQLGIQAVAFGNHEFDFGTGVVRGLIDGSAPGTILGADFTGTDYPYLSGNLNFAPNADLAPLVVPDGGAPQAGKIAGSTVIAVNGELIGVVAAITPTLARISSSGTVGVSPAPFDNVPTPEQLDALAAVIQADVDALLAANPSMNKVILLTHMQQLSIELALAERLENVDIIVAGGSNTRLFDEDDRIRAGDSDQGVYPSFVTNAGGTETAVVNTDGNYKYLGRLVIGFDEEGNLLPETYDSAESGAYATDDQGVADLNAAAFEDAEIREITDLLAADIATQDANFFGLTDVFLNGQRAGAEPDGVRTQETNLGNLTADANLSLANALAADLGETEPVVVSIKNAGGIRASIGDIVVLTGTDAERLPIAGNPLSGRPDGGVSQAAIQTALAFNNGLTLVTVTRAELIQVLEHGVAGSGAGLTPGQFPQLSGIEFSYDLDRPAGDRIVSAAIVDADGTVLHELVRAGELSGDAAQTFRIVTLNFMVAGGDGYPFPSFANLNAVKLYDDTDGDGTPDLTGDRSGLAQFAVDGSEQDTLAEYLAAEYGDTPYAELDTGRDLDERIQNLDFRADTVFDDAVAVTLSINELDSDSAGVDFAEFVELYDGGAGNTALDGLVVVFFNGNGDTAYAAFDLDGYTTDANGFFVLGNAGVTSVDVVFSNGLLQNGADAVAIYQGDAADFVNGTAARTAELVDAIVYGTADPVDDGLLAALGQTVQYDEDANLISPSQSLSRVPDGSASIVAQNPTPGASNVVTADPYADVLISAIQGTPATQEPNPVGAFDNMDASPLRGELVEITAIVVGDFQNGDADGGRSLGGFYVQEEDADADGDAATSEGIFVADGAFGVDVQVGDRVTIRGTVQENFGQTQLSSIASVVVESAGNAAPTVAVIDLSTVGSARAQDGDFIADLEAYEGMLVSFAETLTVSEMFNLDRFNEVRLIQGERALQFTQNNAPDVAGFQAYLEEVGSLSITYDDGLNQQNQPIGNLDGFDPFTTATAVSMGDTVTGLTGVLDYQWAGNAASQSTWRVRATETGQNTFDDTNPPDLAPEAVGGDLRVASLNVLNFFTTLDANGAVTSVGLEPRGANSAEELARQIEKTVTTLIALDADVIGLVEIENDVASAPLAALTAALNAELGGDIYGYVNTGQVGTDAITGAFLYRKTTVSLAGDAAILDDAAFVNPLSVEPANRPAIAQTFTEIASGESFTAVVNHLKSKASPTSAPADLDQGDGQGASNATRAAAAAVLADWLATNPTGDPSGRTILLGDYNAYAAEDPVQVLLEAGYDDLAQELIGDDAYSFVFDGFTGTLDYAFTNEDFTSLVADVTEWHVNSDEADALDYNLDFGRDPTIFDGTSPLRNSDHDPVIVGLNLVSDVDLYLGEVRNGPVVFEDGYATFARALDDAGDFDEIRIVDAAAVGDLGTVEVGVTRLTLTADAGVSADIVLTGAAQSFVAFGTFAVDITGGDLNDELRGNRSDNTLTGGAGRDALHGREGNDVLDGGLGNDQLTGFSGADTFVFQRGGGADVVWDFRVGQQDRIDLSDFGFAGFADIAADLTQGGQDVFLDLGEGDVVRFRNRTVDLFTEEAFVFDPLVA